MPNVPAFNRRAMYQEMIEEAKAKILDISIAWQQKLRRVTSLDEAARMQVIVEILLLHAELIRLEQDVAIARRRIAELGNDDIIPKRADQPQTDKGLKQ